MSKMVATLPFSLIVPEVGFTTPAKTFNNVLLPLPLAPMIATLSPFFTEKVRLSSALNDLFEPEVVALKKYSFDKSLTSIATELSINNH